MENKKIAILMATYNGEKFLNDQLLSIKNQDYKNWHLYVLDDGSTDNTVELLKNFQGHMGDDKVTVLQQANQGSLKTFLTLLCDPKVQADYYAFSDQDDVWDADKLQKAAVWLSAKDAVPALYCANVRLTDEAGEVIDVLPPYKKAFCFQHALVQCIAMGNTMVFNQALRKILLSVGVFAGESVHDWWTYLVVTACGGEVYYDVNPALSYRQHAQNVIGFSASRFTRYQKSLQRVLGNNFKHANDCHVRELEKLNSQMTVDSKRTLDLFKQARQGNVVKRLWCLYRSGVYRQDFVGTCGLYVAVVLGRV